MNKTNNKKKLATVVMAGLGITCILGGAFALMYDDLTHTQSVTVEWVEIVDGSTTMQIEDVANPDVEVTELTPGHTYTVTGTLANDSTVVTNWVATANGATGIDVVVGDSDGDGLTDAEEINGPDTLPGTGDETDPLVAETPIAVGTPVDVESFDITITATQDVAVESVPTDISFTFNATDGRNI